MELGEMEHGQGATVKRKRSQKQSRIFSVYDLYEKSVQSSDHHVQWFTEVYQEIRGGKTPRHLREDFAGTFKIACEWVQLHPENTAIALDLDPAPLAHGKRNHLSSMTPHQRRRVQPIRQNVVSVTRPGRDMIVACNFSFNIFKRRSELLRYFRACRQSLAKDGILILEQAGGPGMIETMKESRGVTVDGKRLFTYVWDQKTFNPITRECTYGIHFKFPDGKILKDAFTYDWRLWTIPELRDALIDAGFKDTCVYWDREEDEDDELYVRTDQGDNAHSWLSYIIGMR